MRWIMMVECVAEDGKKSTAARSGSSRRLSTASPASFRMAESRTLMVEGCQLGGRQGFKVFLNEGFGEKWPSRLGPVPDNKILHTPPVSAPGVLGADAVDDHFGDLVEKTRPLRRLNG
jgi:hypothetical protein